MREVRGTNPLVNTIFFIFLSFFLHHFLRHIAIFTSFCRSFNYNCVILLIETKKIERFAKNAHIEIPFEKNRTDTLVGPNETEKIITAVLSVITLTFFITRRGGLTDKAVDCDAEGPWYESTCEHNIFSSFYLFYTSIFICFSRFQPNWGNFSL